MSITQGLFQFKGKLYAAWKGEVGDSRLFFSPFNGTIWQSETAHIPGNSSIGPSLASPAESVLYAAWKSENGDSDQRIFYSNYNGSVWSPQAQIPRVASSVGPTLGVLKGVLYAAWKGEEGDNQIYWSRLNGSTWATQQPIPGAFSSIGPSLAGWDQNGLLYAGWVAPDQSLHFAQFNGSIWSTGPNIPGNPGSTIGPSLAQVGNALYAAWKGAGNDQGIYYAVFQNGDWSGQAQLPNVASSIGPVLAAYGSLLYAMWKGEGADQSLYYASFENGAWSAQNTLPGNTGQDYVAPPVGGLTNASNYWIYSNGNPVTGLTVSIDVTKDLVFDSNVKGGSKGFSFQLNAFSKIGANIIVGWQQFIYNVNTANSPGATQFNGQFETWPAQNTINGIATNGSDLINLGRQITVLSTSGINGVPAGFQLAISLGTDANSNVNSAIFSVTDPNSNNGRPYSITISPLGFPLDGSLPKALQGPATEKDFAPILAFQLVLVGPDGNQVKLSSGEGTITYKTTSSVNLLTALSVPPPTINNVTTGEGANSIYNTMLNASGASITQTFSAA